MRSEHWLGERTRALAPAGALLVMLAAAMAVSTPDRALADDADEAECGLQTLRGSYVFAATGYNIVAGVPVPKTIVELLDFEGDGTVTVTGGTLSVNGIVTQNLAGVGVYTLGADCKGTLTFTGPRFDLFVDHPGKQALMLQTNPGTVFQGTVTKVAN